MNQKMRCSELQYEQQSKKLKFETVCVQLSFNIVAKNVSDIIIVLPKISSSYIKALYCIPSFTAFLKLKFHHLKLQRTKMQKRSNNDKMKKKSRQNKS